MTRIRTRRPVRRRLIAFAAGAVAFSVFVAGGAAFAMWRAYSIGTVAVSTPTVSVSTAGFPSAAMTFENHLRDRTSSFTVTNTGSAAGNVSLNITTANTVFAPFVGVQVWTVPNAAACTASSTPTGGATGTMQATTFNDATVLNAGASRVYCMRSRVPIENLRNIGQSSGAQTMTPSLNVAIASSGWTANASATATVGTRFIYTRHETLSTTSALRFRAPSAGNCMASNTSTSVSIRSCTILAIFTNSDAQYDVLKPIAAQLDRIKLRPINYTNTRVAAGTSALLLQTDATSAPAQEFFVQRVSSTTVQLVSAADGRCIVLGSSTATSVQLASCGSSGTAIEVYQ